MYIECTVLLFLTDLFSFPSKIKYGAALSKVYSVIKNLLIIVYLPFFKLLLGMHRYENVDRYQ